jgi:hypothetical protein
VAARSRRRRDRGHGDLPPEIKGVIQDYVAFTNESLRAAVTEYFEDKASTERRHGTIETWDVGRVTDMSTGAAASGAAPSAGGLAEGLQVWGMLMTMNIRRQRRPAAQLV